MTYLLAIPIGSFQMYSFPQSILMITVNLQVYIRKCFKGKLIQMFLNIFCERQEISTYFTLLLAEKGNYILHFTFHIKQL